MVNARLAEIDAAGLRDAGGAAGDPGGTSTRPELARLRERADASGYDRLVVYADREHSANLAYLTGFDPRFEEAVLVLGPADEPAILVGNECQGMAAQAPLPMRDDPLPGPQPAGPAARSVGARWPRSWAARASARAAGSG